MIFVDTNVFLRFLMPPTTTRDREMKAVARALFNGIESGEAQATTSEVVLHEVCFLLGAKSHYHLDPETVIRYVRSILSWPGWTFPAGDHALYMRALEIFADFPRLGFADAVIAARVEALDIELATFDRRLGALSFLRNWTPPGSVDV